MKFVLAPDSFKECMSALDAATAMKRGILKVFPNAETALFPMADGGEGTLDALVNFSNGKKYTVLVANPLGEKVAASYGISGDGKTAFIEVAEACGIQLIDKEKRNPLITTTYGVGEILNVVIKQNVETVIMALGGSCTNDGGVGMLQALGAKFLDADGNSIGVGGAELAKIKQIDLSELNPRLKEINIIAACDVKSPLTGPMGATHVFAKQKGASDKDIEVLESAMKNYSQVAKSILGIDIDNVPGCGAAGGLGAAIIGFLNAKIQSGFDIVANYSNIEQSIKEADIIFVGEGCLDSQTKQGKVPWGVAQIARKYNKTVIAFCGKRGEGVNELYKEGIKMSFEITPEGMPLCIALKLGQENMERSAYDACRFIDLFIKP